MERDSRKRAEALLAQMTATEKSGTVKPAFIWFSDLPCRRWKNYFYAGIKG